MVVAELVNLKHEFMENSPRKSKGIKWLTSIFISDTDRANLTSSLLSKNTPPPPPYLNTLFLLNFAYSISRGYIFLGDLNCATEKIL